MEDRPLIVDSHMHTPLCRHAVGQPEHYAATAAERGLDGVVFTCHSPMPDGFSARVRMRPEEFDDYLDLVARARAACEGEVAVRLGMESDYFPGMEDWLRDLHARADFDYTLGSVHYFLDEWEPLFPPLGPHEPDVAEAHAYFAHYFDRVAESAETGLFDALAHADLVKSAAPEAWDFDALGDMVGAALDRVAAAGVAMEINTSGRIKAYAEFNPGPPMLRLMRERGIPVVLGSDSHHPLRVGAHFEEALDWLETAGYDNVSAFRERRRYEIPIERVRAALRPGWTVDYATGNRELTQLAHPEGLDRFL